MSELAPLVVMLAVCALALGSRDPATVLAGGIVGFVAAVGLVLAIRRRAA